MAGTFVNRIGYVVEPFLALYLAGPRNLTPAVIGVVLACFGAGSFVSQIVGGYLADRLGRRMTLVIGMVGTAACFMVLASVRHLAFIAAAAAMTGLFLDVYRPAVSAAVADLVPPAARPRAFALIYWAINLGVAVAGILGGVLADRSYWLLFVLDAVTCLAFAVIIARTVPETKPKTAAGKSGGYIHVLKDGIAVGLFVSILLGTLVYMQQLVTLPLAVRASGLSAAAYGVIYAVNPIAGDRGSAAGAPTDRPASSRSDDGGLITDHGRWVRVDSVRGLDPTVRPHSTYLDYRRDWVQRRRSSPHRRDRTGGDARPLQRSDRHGVRRGSSAWPARRHLVVWHQPQPAVANVPDDGCALGCCGARTRTGDRETTASHPGNRGHRDHGMNDDDTRGPV